MKYYYYVKIVNEFETTFEKILVSSEKLNICKLVNDFEVFDDEKISIEMLTNIEHFENIEIEYID